MKKKRRTPEQLRKRMRRPARLVDARQWLSTYQGADTRRDYERWYGVDPRCALAELRLLGVALPEDAEAQVRHDVERRAKARAARRAEALAAKRAKRAREAAKRVQRAKAKEAKEAARGYAASWAEAAIDALIERGWDDADDASIGWDDADDASIGWEDAGFEVGYDTAPDLAPDLPRDDQPRVLEDTLLGDARALDPRVIETKVESLDEDNVRVRVILEEDPEALARCAWSLIYAIGAFAFTDTDADADLDHAEPDEWTAADMLRCLSFERGRLRFHADHVRGRCMQTTVEIDSEGKIMLETVNRGMSALGWIAKLGGKKATDDLCPSGGRCACVGPCQGGQVADPARYWERARLRDRDP